MTNVGKNSKLKSKNSKGLQIFESCLLTFEFQKKCHPEDSGRPQRLLAI